MQELIDQIHKGLEANFDEIDRQTFERLKEAYIELLNGYPNRQTLILDEALTFERRLEICQKLNELQKKILWIIEKESPSKEKIKETLDTLNEFIATQRDEYHYLPRISFQSGADVGMQVGSFHYCSPRVNDADKYTDVELGKPSKEPPDYIMKHAEDPRIPLETVYGWTPLELVARWAVEEGGLVLPKTNQTP
jgi:hypothetical protein